MKPILAASAVVTDAQGRFLLVQRATEPEAGKWTVPGGKVEIGETLEEAAAREVLEETGVTVDVGHELGTLSLPAPDGRVFDIHDFTARYVSGFLRAGDDAADAQWFAAEQLPSLPLTQNLLQYLTNYGVYP